MSMLDGFEWICFCLKTEGFKYFSTFLCFNEMLKHVMKFFSPMAINVQTVFLIRGNIVRPFILYKKLLRDFVKCFRPFLEHFGAKKVC